MALPNELPTIDTLSANDQALVWNLNNGDTRRASMTVVAAYVSSNLGVASGTSGTFSSFIKVPSVTVASLPAAATAGNGARATVSDATQTLTAGIGAVATGGGANVVPVFSDGTNWRIG